MASPVRMLADLLLSARFTSYRGLSHPTRYLSYLPVEYHAMIYARGCSVALQFVARLARARICVSYFSNTISNCSKVSLTASMRGGRSYIAMRRARRIHISSGALVFYSDGHYRSLNITAKFYARQAAS